MKNWNRCSQLNRPRNGRSRQACANAALPEFWDSSHKIYNAEFLFDKTHRHADDRFLIPHQISLPALVCPRAGKQGRADPRGCRRNFKASSGNLGKLSELVRGFYRFNVVHDPSEHARIRMNHRRESNAFFILPRYQGCVQPCETRRNVNAEIALK